MVKGVRRATRKHYLAKAKNRIVLNGLRGEMRIAEPCRSRGHRLTPLLQLVQGAPGKLASIGSPVTLSALLQATRARPFAVRLRI